MNKHLFGEVMRQCSLKNHYELARRLDTTPAQISRMVTETNVVGATIILSVHERIGIPVAVIRKLIAEGRN